MRFNLFGKIDNPVVIMLPGSFAPGNSMEKIYNNIKDEFYIIVPEYTGHYENSTFSTRKEEAEKIKQFIIENKITNIKLIYGQSMGTEIGMELLDNLLKSNIKVEKAFFDGAPFIKLSYLYKKFMYFKFKTMINMFRNKTIDEVMDWKFLKNLQEIKFSNCVL